MQSDSIEIGTIDELQGTFIESRGKERYFQLLDKPRSDDDRIEKRVKVWWNAEKAWFKGKIQSKTEKGRYLIYYDDGDVSTHAPKLMCMLERVIRTQFELLCARAEGLWYYRRE